MTAGRLEAELADFEHHWSKHSKRHELQVQQGRLAGRLLGRHDRSHPAMIAAASPVFLRRLKEVGQR